MMQPSLLCREDQIEAQARLAAIVDSSDDAIVGKTLEGVVTSWNRSAERIFGYSAAEMVGTPIDVLFPPDRRGEEPQILSRVRRGERVDHFETTRVAKDGREVEVSVTISPVRDAAGRVVGASKIARDVTARKRAERDLRAARDAAEAELKFLSFLSHDLYNNLSGVTIHLQMLRRRLAASPELADDAHMLDDAQQAVRNTVGGMARLLERERLRRAGVAARHQEVNLHDLLARAARRFSEAAGTKGITIRVEAEPDVVAQSDPELLGLVVQNLIGNAVKYASRGTVRVAATRGAGGASVIGVSDEGPGIAGEDLGRIFDAFARGASHGQDGAGLGLTIASQAAKLLGAELTVESAVGAGSTFRLVLPTPAEGGAGPACRAVPAGGVAKAVAGG